MWNPGSLVFIHMAGLGLLRPRVEKVPRQRHGRPGLTLTVLSCKETAFGTKGPTFTYVVMGNSQLFDLKVDFRTIEYFTVVEEA